MYDNEAKMAKATFGECSPEIPRESVELKLNCVGERICTATALVKECMTTLFGVNPKEEKTMPTGTSGLCGLVGALEHDALMLLAAAEELRKRCGG